MQAHEIPKQLHISEVCTALKYNNWSRSLTVGYQRFCEKYIVLESHKNQNSRNEQPHLANFMFNEILFWSVFCALKPFFFLWECCLFNLLFYWTKNKNSADWPIFSDFGCRIRSFFSTNSIGLNKMKRLDLIEYKYQSVNH